MFLYIISVIFLVYMYIVHLRQKSVQESFRNSFQDRSKCAMMRLDFLTSKSLIPGNSDDSIIIKTKSYNRYGSFYFRMGVMGKEDNSSTLNKNKLIFICVVLEYLVLRII